MGPWDFSILLVAREPLWGSPWDLWKVLRCKWLRGRGPIPWPVSSLCRCVSSSPPELGATAGVGGRRLPGSPSPTSFSP